MFFENLMNRGAMPALLYTAVYTEERHRVIAENIANLGVPGYKAKQLDVKAFQKALGRAMDERGDDPSQPFVVGGHAQFRTNDRGELTVTPTDRPPENVLFHDGTNTSIERQMADLAENAMTHELTNSLLRVRFDGLRKAIRGRL